jgi:C1A family cysteine protease
MPRRIRRYGWKPDFPDQRDQFFTASRGIQQALPPNFDLTVVDPRINFPIYDQGQIGSCTANALAAAVQYDRIKLGLAPDFVPARLFIYYNERGIENTIPIDSGAYLRDGMKTLQNQGVCPESDWPYVPTPPLADGGPFPVGSPPATQPPQRAYNDAANYTIVSYQAVQQNLSQLQATLVSGFPFVFGFSVYQSWADTDSTIIPLPSNDDAVVGGHAVLVVAYDNATGLFKFRNSWGPGEGENGYFYMPYAYITNPSLANDFWVINSVKE